MRSAIHPRLAHHWTHFPFDFETLEAPIAIQMDYGFPQRS